MANTIKENYVKVCECCGQSTNYVLEVDKGTARIVQTLSKAIIHAGKNAVHLPSLIPDIISHRAAGNISRPRFHGLVAKIEDMPGWYCLTTKGLSFLNGEPIQRFCIVNKSVKGNPAHTDGYIQDEMTTINDVLTDHYQDYWRISGFDIKDGLVVEQSKQLSLDSIFNKYQI